MSAPSTSSDPVSTRANNGDLSATARTKAFLRRPLVRYGLIGVGAIAAILAVIAVVNNRPVRVEVASVERDVTVRVFGLGSVEARVMSKIGFEVGATLVELNADHGDRVSRGQVLARLSLGEQEAKVARAKATFEIAEVSIKRAEANLEKARVVLAQKQEANRRKQTLMGRDVVSPQVAEETARDESVARADVVVAGAEIASAKAQLSDARAQLQYEETLLGHRTLVAPYDAIVIERFKELGTVVKAGDPIFTLVAVNSYWGLAYVDEARAGFIEEGQRVDARQRSRPQEAFTGKVVRIGLESDRVTEERRVYIKGDNPPPRVFLGEQVEFLITVAKLDKALLVPEVAVRGFNGREGSVWTVEDGRLHQRLVKFRHRTEDSRLEIVGGLPESARVATRIEAGFSEGRSARINEGRAP